MNSPNSLKNAMIFIHNHLAKEIKEEKLQEQLKTIICMLLIYNF